MSRVRVTLDMVIDVRGAEAPEVYDIVFDYLADRDAASLPVSFSEFDGTGVNMILYPDDEEIPAVDELDMVRNDEDNRIYGPGWATYHRER